MSYAQVRDEFFDAVQTHDGELACQDPSVNPDDWFTEPNSPREVSARLRCQDCPIFHECRDYALQAGIPSGTWGGLDEKSRAGIWRRTPGGKPQHFNDEMDAMMGPLLQARRDFETFDVTHGDPYEDAA
jgi:hypothetical protein